MNNPSRIHDIIQFWFEGVDDQTKINNQKSPFNKWFSGKKDFDDQIRARFEEDLSNASNGRFKDWEAGAKGCLSLILLFDQFSRNIYRSTPKMYATDLLALKISLKSIQEKFDQRLLLIERVFIYMPLMHSEDILLQEESIRQFEALVVDSKAKSPYNTHYFENNLLYARRHYEFIKWFGRFPHRNVLLNRPSTNEELEFLKQKGSSF